MLKDSRRPRATQLGPSAQQILGTGTLACRLQVLVMLILPLQISFSLKMLHLASGAIEVRICPAKACLVNRRTRVVNFLCGEEPDNRQPEAYRRVNEQFADVILTAPQLRVATRRGHLEAWNRRPSPCLKFVHRGIHFRVDWLQQVDS